MATNDDYDTPWKTALTRYFPEFMAFYFPQAHAAIDWSQPHVFLDSELAKLAGDGKLGKRLVDKLVRVGLRDGSVQWVLVHVEVQGRRKKAGKKAGKKGWPPRWLAYSRTVSGRWMRRCVSVSRKRSQTSWSGGSITSSAPPRWTRFFIVNKAARHSRKPNPAAMLKCGPNPSLFVR